MSAAKGLSVLEESKETKEEHPHGEHHHARHYPYAPRVHHDEVHSLSDSLHLCSSKE